MVSLFHFEWKKSFGRPALLLVLLLFTIINFVNISYRFQSDSWFADSPGWQKAYWQLYEEISGLITQEKLDHLWNIYEPLAEKVADLTFSRAENPNSLTGINGYSDYLMLERFYVEPMQNFLDYHNRSQQIAQYAQENVSFYTQLGNAYECRKNVKIYNLFINRQVSSFAYTEVWERLSDYTFSTWLTILVCLFAASSSFSIEKEVKMDSLIYTTPNGNKRTAIAKCLSCSTFVLLVTIWFSICDWFGFALNYQTVAGCFMPIYSLADYSATPLQCSIATYFMICSGVRILGILFFTLLCCIFSSLFSNALYPFFVSGTITAASCIAAVASESLYNPCWKTINPASLLFPKSLFATTEYLNCLGEPILAPFFTIIFSLLGIVFFLVLLFRKGKLWGAFVTS